MTIFFSKPFKTGVLCRVEYLRLSPNRSDSIATKFDSAGVMYFYEKLQSCPSSGMDRVKFVQNEDEDPNQSVRTLLQVLSAAGSQAKELPFAIGQGCSEARQLSCLHKSELRDLLSRADPEKISALETFEWHSGTSRISQFTLADAKNTLFLINVTITEELSTKTIGASERRHLVKNVDVYQEFDADT